MLKILIAEDDMMVATMTEDLLRDSGYEVCGIARTVSEAVELAAECKPDIALLDMQLAEGGLGTEIAAELAPFEGMGILYASGYPVQSHLTAVDGHAHLQKPYTSAQLLRALVTVRSLACTGQASPPFFGGFEILPASA
jgi:CheY-like chemotaxis protein